MSEYVEVEQNEMERDWSRETLSSRLVDVPATFVFRPADEDSERPESVSLPLFGEIIFEGEQQKDEFVPAKIQRLVLFGQLFESEHPFLDNVRHIEIGGPMETMLFEPVGEYLWQAELMLRLFYTKIGLTFHEEAGQPESMHPPAEYLHCTLQFELAPVKDEKKALLSVFDLTIEMAETVPEGSIIDFVALSLPTTLLRGVGDPLPRDEKPANSLTASCDQTNSQFRIKASGCAGEEITVQKEVQLKFINLTNHAMSAVQEWVQLQLDEVCRVWCRRAALDLIVETQLLPPNENGHIMDFVFDNEVNQMLGYKRDNGNWVLVDASWWQYHIGDYVPIFIVENLETSTGAGQGVTRFQGTSIAYMVLDVRAIDADTRDAQFFNERILAHELCHVIGLNHSGEPKTAHSYPGTDNSITEEDIPNPADNPIENLRFFKAPQLSVLVLNKKNGNGQDIPACFIPSV